MTSPNALQLMAFRGPQMKRDSRVRLFPEAVLVERNQASSKSTLWSTDSKIPQVLGPVNSESPMVIPVMAFSPMGKVY